MRDLVQPVSTAERGARDAAGTLAFDREHVWHPYASMTSPSLVALVARAEGVHVELADGSRLIDAMASWWCAIHGYRNTELDRAVRAQLDEMAHVMFGGLTHEPATTLASHLIALSAEPLQHVFFSDSGSVSVEVALKMAVQYQRGAGRPGRTRFMALRGGYHGDTTGAMSVSDPDNGMHTMFTGMIADQVFAPRPPGGIDADLESWADQVRQLARQHADEVAGIVCEPVLQGAGGMHVYNPRALTVLREVADEVGALLIFDEIATGFGRTGTFFAAEHAGVAPDISCVGKALTAGYLTLAATLCTTAVAEGIEAAESGVLMHGPTFMANPLACAVANASIRLLESGGWRQRVERIERRLRDGLEPARGRTGVSDVRVIGAVGVIQLDHPVDVAAATAAARSQGVWIRPFRDLVYTMPPYIVSDEQVDLVCSAMIAAVS